MIVAALIRISSAALSSLNVNSPSRRSKGTSTGNTCASHLPAGVLNTAQHAPTTFVFHHEQFGRFGQPLMLKKPEPGNGPGLEAHLVAVASSLLSRMPEPG